MGWFASAPKISGKKYFFGGGKYRINFGHVVNFYAYIFGQKCLAPKVDGAPMPMATNSND